MGCEKPSLGIASWFTAGWGLYRQLGDTERHRELRCGDLVPWLRRRGIKGGDPAATSHSGNLEDGYLANLLPVILTPVLTILLRKKL